MLTGFQNTFSYDSNVMEFVDIEAGQLAIEDENIGKSLAESGMLSVSWNDMEALELKTDEPLFSLVFDAKKLIQLSDELYISNQLTRTEAYDKDLKVMDMALNFRGKNEQSFVLYQNSPNPFLETTDIRFRLPESSEVMLTVFDVTGRELLRKRSNYASGLNTITITRDELQSTGVMYYKIETDYGTDSRKMIQIR